MHAKSTNAIPKALAAAAIVLAGGLAPYRSQAAAIIGPQEVVDVLRPNPVSPTLDQMKGEYLRPETIPFPPSNPYTLKKAVLGKKLFFDTRLSSGNLLSCATCHNPGFGWGDAQPKAIGHAMNVLARRSPSIVNAAWNEAFMWDGREPTLETQALGPIAMATEMNMSLAGLTERLAGIGEYKPLFAAAFGADAVTAQNIAKALATFERTVVSAPAPFDSWIEGDERAISEDAKRGFVLFNTKAGCAQCHRGWNFTDDSFHDVGLESPDLGRGKLVPDTLKLQHAFKTPGLREIARRAPFTHDGSLPTLEAVIDHYDRGGIERPSRSDVIKPLGLTPQEKADLLAFLQTLTGRAEPMSVPLLPR